MQISGNAPVDLSGSSGHYHDLSVFNTRWNDDWDSFLYDDLPFPVALTTWNRANEITTSTTDGTRVELCLPTVA
jgi:hypothetical protein